MQAESACVMGDQLEGLICAESLQTSITCQRAQSAAYKTLLALKIVDVLAGERIGNLDRSVWLVYKVQYTDLFRPCGNVVWWRRAIPANPGYQCQTGDEK
jgi:hypothetical protein